MKVFDLSCDNGHVFEGWFGSEADYADQIGKGLLTCPACHSPHIHKKLSAPRLNFGARPPKNILADKAPVLGSVNQQTSSATISSTASIDHQGHAAALRSMWQLLRAQSVNVGADFAEEARRMHYGETPERMIHGKASVKEALELVEEGVLVVPLPPDADTEGLSAADANEIPPVVPRH
jgi:hypothetical protein